MSWTERDGIDYEDAKRPTADEPDNKTGWVAYYAWGRGGSGMYRPNYLFRPGEDSIDTLREDISYYHESWMEHAESAYLTIHRGVVPPLSVVKSALKSARNRADAANVKVKLLEDELEIAQKDGRK